jgi:hypothetical protein
MKNKEEDMFNYPISEIRKSASTYQNRIPGEDAVAFETERIKQLTRYLLNNNIQYDSIYCCKCNETRAIYLLANKEKRAYIWLFNSHPEKKDVTFRFKLDVV